MNRWLAQLGLVAPGGPLNDKNFHKAVTVLDPISAKSMKIKHFGSSDSFFRFCTNVGGISDELRA